MKLFISQTSPHAGALFRREHGDVQVEVRAADVLDEGRHRARRFEMAEQALLSMLSAGLIPAKLLEGQVFSNPQYQALAEYLISGNPISAYIDSLSDDAARETAMRALNYSPLPVDGESAARMAEDCLRTIQKQRAGRRIDQLKQQISTAPPEQKAELYQKLAALMKQLDG